MVSGSGPESSRRSAAIEAHLPIPTPLPPSDPLSDRSATLAGIAAQLCPDGPRPATEIAAALGCEVRAADLPAEVPVFVAGGVVLYRDDERAERSILEGVSVLALRVAGYDACPADAAALASRLSRPAVVRSA